MLAALPVFIALSLQAAVPPTGDMTATPVAPVVVTATAPSTPAPEDSNLDQTVCRSETVVGSRFPTRTCLTRREWNARRDESRELAHKLDAVNSNRGRVYAPGH